MNMKCYLRTNNKVFAAWDCEIVRSALWWCRCYVQAPTCGIYNVALTHKGIGRFGASRHYKCSECEHSKGFDYLWSYSQNHDVLKIREGKCNKCDHQCTCSPTAEKFPANSRILHMITILYNGTQHKKKLKISNRQMEFGQESFLFVQNYRIYSGYGVNFIFK